MYYFLSGHDRTVWLPATETAAQELTVIKVNVWEVEEFLRRAGDDEVVRDESVDREEQNETGPNHGAAWHGERAG